MALLELTGDLTAHDPVIVKEKSSYYCFGTHGYMSVSDDLRSWKSMGNIYGENAPWVRDMVPGNKNDMWAPEVVQRDGKWRMYYSVSAFGKNTSAIGLRVSATLDPSSPEYGWQDQGVVIASRRTDNFNAIDPAVCTDSDGTDWLLFGSFWKGLFMVPLTAGGKIRPDAVPMNVASRGRGGANPLRDENPIEGGFIFSRGGYYYLFASHDFCCRGTASTYHIVLGVSRSITGPYLDSSGEEMLLGGGTTLRDGASFKRWAGPGHNTVFHDTDGKDYLVYHAYDRTNKGKPSLMIEPVTWKDDWPEF